MTAAASAIPASKPVCDPEADAPVRGRPRSIEVDQAILQAATELLEEEGFDRLSMEAVAHRAGVGKATLYRRWSGKVELVIDIIEAAIAEFPIPDTGATRSDLVAMSKRARSMIEGRVGRIMHAVSLELSRNEVLAEAVRESLLEPRREALRGVIRRGVARGDLRPDVDVDLVLDAIVGTLHYRVQSMGEVPTDRDAEALVDLVLNGVAPR